MFRRQSKPVLAALNAMRAELEAAQTEQLASKAADITMQTLWNSPEMTGEMTADVLAELERILQAAAVSIAADFAKQGLRLSWDVFDREAQQWAATYGYNLIKQINDSTQRQIAQSISRWIGEPEDFEALVKDIRRIMPARAVQPGIRDRARLIAQTETTRVYAESRMIAMQTEGLQYQTWHTAADELVCPICQPLNDKTGTIKAGVLNPDDGQYYKPPAHPGCRCWLTASTDELAERVQAQEDEAPIPASEDVDIGEMDEDLETARFSRTADEIAESLDLSEEERDQIQEDLYEWAVDSHSRAGVIYQIAASQEFGASLSDYTLNKAAEFGIRATANFDQEKQILRYIYDNKSQFKSGTVKLYRATDQLGRNALESWTTDRDIAAFYVQRNRSGRILEEMIPAERIVGSWRDGIGLEFAKEVVVIGS